VIAGRLLDIGIAVLPGGALIFPLTYIFGDVLTECYGFKRSRLIIWTGFAANMLMVGVFYLLLALPYPVFFQDGASYATVLGMTGRVVAASLVAYFFGEFSNSIILSGMKKLTKGKWLWTRTIGSTLAGEGIDTLLFVVIAFAGTMPLNVLFDMVLAQYVWKVMYEVLATPLTYLVVGWIKRVEHADVYDRGIKYYPFSLEA
jgi:uncharacterized integral membrane protein (TIGR00697 family)